MRLHSLKPRPGSKHRNKRLGCGESSGKGKTSGKGHKGQKSRSGASIRPGFEGGQMPLYRRLPRRGFNNKQFKTQYAEVNVSTLEAFFDAGSTVDESALREKGLVQGKRWDGIKVLGNGDLAKSLTVLVDAYTGTAREKIEKAGGKANLIPQREVLPKGTPVPGKRTKAAAKPASAAKAAAPAAKPKAKAKAEPEAPAAAEEE